MEKKTYETIIELLSNELAMERWRTEAAQKELEKARAEIEEAKKIIDYLQKEIKA